MYFGISVRIIWVSVGSSVLGWQKVYRLYRTFQTKFQKGYLGNDLNVNLSLGHVSLAHNMSCAVKGAGPQWVKVLPGNWFAPPGSNQSSSEGNEAAEASGV